MAASAISIVVGDRVDAGIILTIVVVSAGLGFVQETRSATAVQALRARLALRATAVRDGAVTDVPVADLVVGDVVLLAAGDIVPADGRLLETNHLFVDESAMTGESAPVAKAVEGADGSPASAAQADGSAPAAAGREHLVFFGTSVISGTGRAVVVATGPRTEYGLIARRLEERPPRNDFERGVRRFGLLIARIILLLVMGVFAADVALQKPLLDSFLFALALAVGLTPELLPAIVTVNLSRGARALASHGVLVRRLPAIQNLGSMTVLCTDKTGTLTEGRLTLVRSIGVAGEAAPDAVSVAWLNSHFETGFSNPLDAAILTTAQGPPDAAAYGKVAELPFDFQRRCLSVVLTRPDGSNVLICKGAPEAVLARSTQVRGSDGAAQPLETARAGGRGGPDRRRGGPWPAGHRRRDAIRRCGSRPGRGGRTRPRVRGPAPVQRPAQGRHRRDAGGAAHAGRRPAHRHGGRRAGRPCGRPDRGPAGPRGAHRPADREAESDRLHGSGPGGHDLRPGGPRPEVARHPGAPGAWRGRGVPG